MNKELEQLGKDLVAVFNKHGIEIFEGSLRMETKPCYRNGENLIVLPMEITFDRVLSYPKKRIDGTYEDVFV